MVLIQLALPLVAVFVASTPLFVFDAILRFVTYTIAGRPQLYSLLARVVSVTLRLRFPSRASSLVDLLLAADAAAVVVDVACCLLYALHNSFAGLAINVGF